MKQASDNDFPVLTDVISGSAPQQHAADGSQVGFTNEHLADHAHLPDLQQIEDMLSERLIAELSLQVPVLVEAALREHLPQALGAKLQAEIMTALTNALPVAAHATAGELSSKVAYEVGGLLEQRLQDEVRRAVADEVTRLTDRP